MPAELAAVLVFLLKLLVADYTLLINLEESLVWSLQGEYRIIDLKAYLLSTTCKPELNKVKNQANDVTYQC